MSPGEEIARRRGAMARSSMQQQVSAELGDVERVWSEYFPEEIFTGEDRRVKLVEELADFFVAPQAQPLLSQVRTWLLRDFASCTVYAVYSPSLPCYRTNFEFHCEIG